MMACFDDSPNETKRFPLQSDLFQITKAIRRYIEDSADPHIVEFRVQTNGFVYLIRIPKYLVRYSSEYMINNSSVVAFPRYLKNAPKERSKLQQKYANMIFEKKSAYLCARVGSGKTRVCAEVALRMCSGRGKKVRVFVLGAAGSGSAKCDDKEYCLAMEQFFKSEFKKVFLDTDAAFELQYCTKQGLMRLLQDQEDKCEPKSPTGKSARKCECKFAEDLLIIDEIHTLVGTDQVWCPFVNGAKWKWRVVTNNRHYAKAHIVLAEVLHHSARCANVLIPSQDYSRTFTFSSEHDILSVCPFHFEPILVEDLGDGRSLVAVPQKAKPQTREIVAYINCLHNKKSNAKVIGLTGTPCRNWTTDINIQISVLCRRWIDFAKDRKVPDDLSMIVSLTRRNDMPHEVHHRAPIVLNEWQYEEIMSLKQPNTLEADDETILKWASDSKKRDEISKLVGHLHRGGYDECVQDFKRLSRSPSETDMTNLRQAILRYIENTMNNTFMRTSRRIALSGFYTLADAKDETRKFRIELGHRWEPRIDASFWKKASRDRRSGTTSKEKWSKSPLAQALAIGSRGFTTNQLMDMGALEERERIEAHGIPFETDSDEVGVTKEIEEKIANGSFIGDKELYSRLKESSVVSHSGQKYRPVETRPAKFVQLLRDLESAQDDYNCFPVIVYLNKEVEAGIKFLQEFLNTNNTSHRVESIYGEMSAAKRSRIKKKFEDEEVDVLIFGDVFQESVTLEITGHIKAHRIGQNVRLHDDILYIGYRPPNGTVERYTQILDSSIEAEKTESDQVYGLEWAETDPPSDKPITVINNKFERISTGRYRLNNEMFLNNYQSFTENTIVAFKDKFLRPLRIQYLNRAAPCRRAFIMAPDWNSTGERQAVGRISRASSHPPLYLKRNQTRMDTIQIYRYIACRPIDAPELKTDEYLEACTNVKDAEISRLLSSLENPACSQT